ncbi:MAG: L-ribulose-5-phosphate 3-epimerase [Anaerolineae bacterium]
MMKHRIGLYEKGLPEAWPWSRKLDSAKGIGFDFMEIAIDHAPERLGRLDWTDQEKNNLRQAISDSGIPIFNVVLSAHRTWPFGSASADVRHKAIEIGKKAVDFAAAIGIRCIQIAGYFVFDEPHTSQSRGYFIDGLSQTADFAASAGVMLGLENMDGEDVISLRTALAITTEINNPWLKLYPDVGNLAANQLDVEAELKLATGQLVGVHLKDTQVGVYRRVPYGGGITPFKQVAETLCQIGYHGPVTLEMWNDDADDSLETVTQSLNWIQEQFK